MKWTPDESGFPASIIQIPTVWVLPFNRWMTSLNSTFSTSRDSFLKKNFKARCGIFCCHWFGSSGCCRCRWWWWSCCCHFPAHKYKSLFERPGSFGSPLLWQLDRTLLLSACTLSNPVKTNLQWRSEFPTPQYMLTLESGAYRQWDEDVLMFKNSALSLKN